MQHYSALRIAQQPDSALTGVASRRLAIYAFRPNPRMFTICADGALKASVAA